MAEIILVLLNTIWDNDWLVLKMIWVDYIGLTIKVGRRDQRPGLGDSWVEALGAHEGIMLPTQAGP